jgi:hydrogenase expression/formation protein HypC
MCLGIPGQIVEWVDTEHHIAKAEVSGVRRNVNAALLAEGPDAVDVGDWVLIHVGFAISKIDEDEARATRELLEGMGAEYEQELAELRASVIE